MHGQGKLQDNMIDNTWFYAVLKGDIHECTKIHAKCARAYQSGYRAKD